MLWLSALVSEMLVCLVAVHLPLCSSELASKLRLLEGKLLRGEQRGGLDRLAQEAAAQLSWQQAELRKQRAAEEEAARRIAALEANAQAVQTHTMPLQVRRAVRSGTARMEHGDAQLQIVLHYKANNCASAWCGCSPLPQEEAAAVTAQLEVAVAEHEAARAELGDVLQAWQRDREELAEQIRCAVWGWMGAGPAVGHSAGLPTTDVLLCCRPACAPAQLFSKEHAGMCRCPSVPRALHYNLALKTLVIDAFIPQEEVSKVGGVGVLRHKLTQTARALRGCVIRPLG